MLPALRCGRRSCRRLLDPSWPVAGDALRPRAFSARGPSGPAWSIGSVGPLTPPRLAAPGAIGALPLARRRAATAAEAGDAVEPEHLTVAAKTNTGKLAGAIAEQVRKKQSSSIIGAGPDACHNALKAMTIATNYLQDAFPGQVLGTLPKKQVRLEPGGREMHYLVLNVQLFPGMECPDQANIHLTKDANVGVLAAELVAELKRRDVVMVAGLGPYCALNMVKATIVAVSYLENDGYGGQIVVAPMMQPGRDWDENRTRMVYACFRTSPE